MITIKDAYYFPHDSNAKDDPKCVLLIEQLGLEGYGIFWVLVETLRDQPEYKYPLALLPALARRYNTTHDKMKVVVYNYGLFKIENDEFFFSESLRCRMERIDYKRELARIAGEKSAEKRLLLANRRSTDVQPTFNDRSTDVQPTFNGRSTDVQPTFNDRSTDVQPTFNGRSTDVQPTFNDRSTSKVNKSKVNNIEEDEEETCARKAEIFKFYQQNIGLISPHQTEVINSFLDDGMSPDLVVEILKDSLGKSDKWSWAKKVMQNCIEQNVFMVEQYNAKKVEAKNEAEKPKSRDGPNNKKQPFKPKEVYL